MVALQDFIAAVYAQRLYIGIFIVSAYVLSNYASYRRLAHIKGPALAEWSNFWLVRNVYNLNTHLELYKATEKYGSLARIGPNLLVTSDPEIIIHMNRARSGYTKSEWYKGIRLQPGHDSVFSTTDEREHTKRRAQMAMGYSGKENPRLEDRIDKHLTNFVNLVRNKYISTDAVLKPMDLARKAQFLTLDIITDLAFDVPFGDIKNDEDVHLYIQSTEETMQAAIMLSTIPAMNSFLNLPVIGDMIFPSSKDQTGPGRLIRVAEEVVKKRYRDDPTGTQMDMMGSFMRHGVKEYDAVAESLLQILAGADTTGTATRATMLHVMTNPRVYNRLQTEIDDYLRSTDLPRDQIISSKNAETLPYLQAVIKEGLRIFPPVTGLFPKITPPEGDTINGIFIPGGTQIGYCAWGVHRNRDVFGSDPELFRPERWLETTGEKLAAMDRTIDLVFGHGKYQCLGQNIAWMELNKIFFELMRGFEWTIIDPTNPWKSGNVGLWLQRDLWVGVTERSEVSTSS